MEAAGSSLHQEISSWPGDTASSHKEIIKHLVRKAGFSRKVLEVITLDNGLQSSTLLRKVFRFFHWCSGQNLSPCEASVPHIGEFLYLWKELKLLAPVVKGYHATINHVFSLACLNLAANLFISRMFGSFKKTCPPREVKPPE